MDEETFKRLRAPFPSTAVGKLPRVTQKDGAKKKCNECGGYLPPHIHLDYVGHAAVTDRLLEVDPEWQWEPAALGPDGLPLVRIQGVNATLWIRLTVKGVTRMGVGIAPANAFELEKQLISDAIRNAAMRFGVALDLWAKEDLHADEEVPAARPSKKKDTADRDAGAAASPTGPTPVHQGGADRPPCEWTEAQIMAMTPPQLMNALKKLGQLPEGSAADWRAQLVGMIQ